MRTWRVGTFSMGASLLFLGIFLLFSQLFDLDLTRVMLGWWPVILVVLGIEILVFLFLSQKEKSFLKYDFLSILFVGILGTVGIGFTLFSSIGMFEKIDDWLNQEEQTMDLPVFEYEMVEDIKRVVVDTGSAPLTIEGILEKEVTVFGTYRSLTGEKGKLISKVEDYVSAKQKGDTLYLSLKDLPSKSVEPFGPYGDSLSATVLVPSDVKLEVMGNDNTINLKPRTLMSNWTIDRASNLSVQMENTGDVKISVKDVQDFQADREKWNIIEESTEEGIEEPTIKEASYQTGNGSHHLQIINSYQVNVDLVD